MQCRCGYAFDSAADIENRKYRSFAVVDDRDYPALMRAELRVSNAKDDSSKLRALGRAAQYVSTMLECPACLRLMLGSPFPADDRTYYVREADDAS
jgi:hypothetical protein